MSAPRRGTSWSARSRLPTSARSGPISSSRGSTCSRSGGGCRCRRSTCVAPRVKPALLLDLRAGARGAAQGRPAALPVARHHARAPARPGLPRARSWRCATRSSRASPSPTRFRQEGELYPPIFSASLVAGERSGNLDAVLRRFAAAPAPQPVPQEEGRLGVGLPDRAADDDGRAHPRDAAVRHPAVPSRSTPTSTRSCRFPRASSSGSRASSARTSSGWCSAVAALVVALVAWLRREGSGVAMDRALLRVPYLGGLLRMYATSQLMRTLSTLLAGGLPLLNALEVASESIGNRAMAPGDRGLGLADPRGGEPHGRARVDGDARAAAARDGQGGRADGRPRRHARRRLRVLRRGPRQPRRGRCSRSSSRCCSW